MSDYAQGEQIAIYTNPPFETTETSPVTPTDPSAIVLTVTRDGQETVTFTFEGSDPTGTITRLADGSYRALLDSTPGAIFAQPIGRWEARWKGENIVEATSPMLFFTVGP